MFAISRLEGLMKLKVILVSVENLTTVEIIDFEDVLRIDYLVVLEAMLYIG